MRRNIMFAVALGVAFGVGIGAAFADDAGYYVSAEGGVSLPPDLHLDSTTLGHNQDSFGTGAAFGGAFGYDYGNGWRVELDTLHQNADVSRLNGAPATGHISSTAVMANATYDLTTDTRVTPYVGAGLGIVNAGGTVNGLSGRDWQPAYQAEAGLRTAIGHDASLFGEYRFSQSESVALSDGTDTAHQHFSDHALLAGVSLKLN